MATKRKKTRTYSLPPNLSIDPNQNENRDHLLFQPARSEVLKKEKALHFEFMQLKNLSILK